MTSSPNPLHRATEQLRGRTEARAVEIASDVLNHALHASRVSLPVRAHPPLEHVRVSDQVIVAHLRKEIDESLAAGAVGRILLQVSRDETLEKLTIELFAQFGTVLVDLADQARVIADQVLARILGPTSVPAVAVVLTHVHVSDVTVGDPHLSDPLDELDR